MISAIVLAAGEAKRMGRAKLLLPWQGKTVLEHVLDQLLHSQVDEIILVLGHEAEQIRKKIPAQDIKIAINPDYQEGMSASLRQGLMIIDEKAEAFLVVLGDQPGISKEIINQLIQAFHHPRHPKGIILPTYRGIRGHPVLFSSQYRKEVLKLKGDVGGRQILKDHPEEILELEMSTDAVLYDIDTPEDYKEYLKRAFPGEGN
ncbi:MAG: molybdenum cofactor cytidylyltransferase [Proteobacteria bacterium]|nr:molybdenum cofactor cytidylyltransferase [Pseudomonadota bacterium]